MINFKAIVVISALLVSVLRERSGVIFDVKTLSYLGSNFYVENGPPPPVQIKGKQVRQSKFLHQDK